MESTGHPVISETSMNSFLKLHHCILNEKEYQQLKQSAADFLSKKKSKYEFISQYEALMNSKNHRKVARKLVKKFFPSDSNMNSFVFVEQKDKKSFKENSKDKLPIPKIKRFSENSCMSPPKKRYIIEEKDNSSLKYACESCKKIEEILYCRDCESFQCISCFSIIHQTEKKQDHSTTDKLIPEKCPFHPDEYIKLYCSSDHSKYCFKCSSEHHKNHQLYSIELFNLKNDIVQFDFSSLKSKVCEDLLESKRKMDEMNCKLQEESKKIKENVMLFKKMEYIKKNLLTQNDPVILSTWSNFMKNCK
eukprot:gene8568-393_t